MMPAADGDTPSLPSMFRLSGVSGKKRKSNAWGRLRKSLSNVGSNVRCTPSS